jgi:regulator of protease activity HflC (stomatin/prohibitin superfamily)
MKPYLPSWDRIPPSGIRQRRTWRQFFFDHLTDLSLFLMAVLLLGVVLFPFMVVNVPSGNVGVLWLRFRGGTVLDPRQLKNEGLRIMAPWNLLFLYDLRLQSTTDTYNAIARDGVSLTATINTRFRLKPGSIPQLHQSIGPNYLATLVRPEIGSRMREVIADYTAEEVYSTKRQEIQDRIRAGVEARMGEKMMERSESEDYEAYKTSLSNMINLVDTLVLNIELPESIVTAINRKIEQYYISEEYTFRVAREMKESERKKIEAQGVRDFQQIVAQGVSDSYLRWRGIEATLQLAQSTNAKTVIIGSGKEGLPIILGNVDSPPPPPKGSSPSNATTPSEERTTAPTPTTSSEKVLASGLTTPAEKMPPPAEKKTPPPAEAETPQYSFPFPLSWANIQAVLAWIARMPPQGASQPATSQ